MSLPLIREKLKRGAITENKQKDLTKSSSTLLVDDEEAPSLLFFIFLSPLSLKSLFAGEVLAWYNSTYYATVDN